MYPKSAEKRLKFRKSKSSGGGDGLEMLYSSGKSKKESKSKRRDQRRVT